MNERSAIVETCRCGARFEFERRRASTYEEQDAVDSAFLEAFRAAHSVCRHAGANPQAPTTPENVGTPYFDRPLLFDTEPENMEEPCDMCHGTKVGPNLKTCTICNGTGHKPENVDSP